MSRPPRPFPSAEEGMALHRRLSTADALAPSDTCAAYLDPLHDWLARLYPTVDPHLRADAVCQALFAYVQRPETYDPGRGDLAAYLRMASRGDLSNLLRKEKRHHEGRVPWPAVELGEESGNLSGREGEPHLRLEHAEEAAEREQLLRSVAEGLSDADRRVLDLMLAGERRHAVYAEALGLDGRPAEERDVKRAMDRIKKRLQRGGGRHD